MNTLKLYILNNLIALDRGMNTLLGGSPEQTMSGRMGADVAAGRCKFCSVVCWILGKIQKDHCANAAAYDAAHNDTTVDAVVKE
jgi:hypothetical protein